jgi:hypothetical protein
MELVSKWITPAHVIGALWIVAKVTTALVR